MKYLAILVLLVGCNSFPKYGVGDCTTDDWMKDRTEFLEENLTYRKIIAVGKKNYLYKFTKSGLQHEAEIFWFDRGSVKVDCPEGF